MRIGSDDSFLSLERVEQEGPTLVWRIQAAIVGAGCIAAVCRRAKVAITDGTLERMADFSAHRVQQFKVILSHGGWLRVKREPRGRTLVRYRVGRLSSGATLEGKVRLKGKAGEVFCREVEGLLCLQ